MKKLISFLFALALIYTVSAQDDLSVSAGSPRTSLLSGKMDLQFVRQIGLDNWSNTHYFNIGLPESSFTEIRGVYNLNFNSSHFGIFADLGLAIMSDCDMKSLDLNTVPMPSTGASYYLRETLSESGNSGVSVNMKLAIGAYRNFKLNNMVSITPCAGIGLMTTTQRKYEVLLKESGTNNQYNSSYIWNCGDQTEDGFPPNLFYLTARVKLSYKLSAKSNLLFGLEYTHCLNGMDYYGKFTNSFNSNVWKDYSIKGNKVNLLGLSLGIGFM